jgi:4-hydroxy-tetrahydrodipicolinate reductase
MQIKIGLCGATGKTSKSIIEKTYALPEQFKITSEFSSKNAIAELATFCKEAEVIIDFSSINILLELLKQCALQKKPLVIGTTGFTSEHFQQIREYSKQIPIVCSANMSLGINLITNLIAKCANALMNEYFDTEIIEYHHRYKKDAPSGTAISLAREIAKAKNIDFESNVMLGRFSNNSRNSNEIGIASVRGGGIYGEHEVIFASNNEVIKLSHQVISRDAYADGALKAAAWIVGKKPGLYSMQDVIAT